MMELTTFFEDSKSARNLLNSIAVSSASVTLANQHGAPCLVAVVIKSAAVSFSIVRAVVGACDWIYTENTEPVNYMYILPSQGLKKYITIDRILIYGNRFIISI
jgi:hypothetical protein